MRDYVLTAIVVGLIPVCLYRPWLGFIAWYWLGLMNPHRMTWSFAYSMPFAAMIGGATLVGILFARDRKPIPWTRELVLMVILLGYFLFTTILAWVPDYAWRQLDKVFKVILMTILATMFIYGRQRIMAMIWTIALSIGFYGFKGFVFVINTGGGGQVKGPENSFLDGNTFLGLGLNMVLPLILYLAREARRPWPRRGLYLLFAMTIVSIIFTTSRGAYLGLAAILPLMFLTARKKWMALAVLVPALVGAQFLPDHIFQRADKIQGYQEDGSANQRLESWSVAWNLAKDYPLTGAGFEFEYAPDDTRWRAYADSKYAVYSKGAMSAHSIYFQMLGQHGFVALAIFIALLLGVLLRLQQVRRLVAARQDLQWMQPHATAIQIGLIGYMVSGAFLSSAYFDLAYLYFAMSAIMWREARTTPAVQSNASEPAEPIPATATPGVSQPAPSMPASRASRLP